MKTWDVNALSLFASQFRFISSIVLPWGGPEGANMRKIACRSMRDSEAAAGPTYALITKDAAMQRGAMRTSDTCACNPERHNPHDGVRPRVQSPCVPHLMFPRHLLLLGTPGRRRESRISFVQLALPCRAMWTMSLSRSVPYGLILSRSEQLICARCHSLLLNGGLQ
jgi:hypothetical protein